MIFKVPSNISHSVMLSKHCRARRHISGIVCLIMLSEMETQRRAASRFQLVWFHCRWRHDTDVRKLTMLMFRPVMPKGRPSVDTEGTAMQEKIHSMLKVLLTVIIV